MNPYSQGFDHGIDFILNEIARIHEQTQSKDILNLLLHLRGEQLKQHEKS